jgi:hypothetical protein
LLSYNCVLNKHETTWCYPIDECTSWPGVGEWKMKELEDRKDSTESVYIPVFIFLSDTTCEVEVV